MANKKSNKDDCTVYLVSELVGKKWTLSILLELYKGKSEFKRFNQIKQKIPSITAKILSERLKELEKEGMIKKRIDTTTAPIRTQYCLTNSGKEFIPIIKKIKEWSLKHQHKNSICDRTNCKDCVF